MMPKVDQIWTDGGMEVIIVALDGDAKGDVEAVTFWSKRMRREFHMSIHEFLRQFKEKGEE